MKQFCQLWLTCANTVEADTIAQALLDEHLVSCVKQTEVNSAFWFKGRKESNEEVLLVMDSRSDLFEAAEAAVAKLHSYDTFVLQAMPVLAVSKKAQLWLKEELK
ncbi:MAG: divalent cation tolerance protein CutA [Candidatus Saccharimonadales bacterium]